MKSSATGKIRFDYTHFFAEVVGPAHGATRKEWRAARKPAADAAREIASARAGGKLPFMDLPHRQKREVEEIQKYARSIQGAADNFVVLGIGGSALGAIALQTALNPAFHNLERAGGRGGRRKLPRLFVEDNVDPGRVADLLDRIDLKSTVFNVVSKSGGTAETMAVFSIVRDRLIRRFGKAGASARIVATTDRDKGILRDIADREGYRTFPVPDGVGGRFSVLSPVGLLPAAAAGIDIRAALAGAAAMDRRCRSEALEENPALAGAALQWLADQKKGKTMTVMMPYSTALRDVADWFRQLWAESLGKQTDRKGRTVNAGQTPIKALGATDQHSQVQLYNEGPNNKTFVFLRVETPNRDAAIPKAFADVPELAYLGGKTLHQLLNAECLATEMAVTKRQRPNGRIDLPRVSAHAVGQLLYALEVQTAYAGSLYGIDAFDQPGVEEGKISAYALMGRPGYEDRAREINAFQGKFKRFVV